MAHELMTIKDVCRHLNIALATYYRLKISDPHFPKPISLGGRMVRHYPDDVRAYLASCQRLS